MNENITVTIEVAQGYVPEANFITSVVQSVLNYMDSANAEINIHVVDDQTIRYLNRKYRKQDRSTNVLSFQSQLPEWVESTFIGDIVLCPCVIQNEAVEYRKSNQSRWAHMLIHGTLHLLGMSHENEDDQSLMELKEIRIMAELGFENPYLVLI